MAGRDGDVFLNVADTNRGRVAGGDVIEAYVHDPASTGEPPEQLRAFQRVWLAPGQTKLVTLEFRPSSFAYWRSGPATGTTPGTTSPTTPTATPSPQPSGHWTIAPGAYRIDLGGSSEQFDGSVTLRMGQRSAWRSVAHGTVRLAARRSGGPNRLSRISSSTAGALRRLEEQRSELGGDRRVPGDRDATSEERGHRIRAPGNQPDQFAGAERDRERRLVAINAAPDRQRPSEKSSR